MKSNKLKGFFYPGNAVSGEPDYRLAEVFVRSAEAFPMQLNVFPDKEALKFTLKISNWSQNVTNPRCQ